MAGRLRLAATGVQDEWLTGEPQFSYFLMNFKDIQNLLLIMLRVNSMGT